jgi:hypothetical protein
MSDFFARLGARALGVAPTVRPAVAPMFSPADRTEAAVTARLSANARAFDASRGDSKDPRGDDFAARALDAPTPAGSHEWMPSAYAWLMSNTAASAMPRETPPASSSSWRDDALSGARDRSTDDSDAQRARAALDRDGRRPAIAVAATHAATAGDRRDAADDAASRRHAVSASASADDQHAHASQSDRESGRVGRDLAAMSTANARTSDTSSDASSDASRALNARTSGALSPLTITPASMRDAAGSVAAPPRAHGSDAAAAEFLARLSALGPRGRRDRDRGGDGTASNGAEAAPVVRISIGRVEVRGGSPRTVIVPPAAAAPRQDVALADYLTRKRGEQP